MCGLPGELLEIHPPYLVINGEVATEPEMIQRLSKQEKIGDWAPYPYAGFTLPSAYADPRKPDNQPPPWYLFEYFALKPTGNVLRDAIQLGPSDYFALGDNSLNSQDSRYWGAAPAKNLLGPGAVVYWPFFNPRWGRIP
jgi:signal peptidase I